MVPQCIFLLSWHGRVMSCKDLAWFIFLLYDSSVFMTSTKCWLVSAAMNYGKRGGSSRLSFIRLTKRSQSLFHTHMEGRTCCLTMPLTGREIQYRASNVIISVFFFFQPWPSRSGWPFKESWISLWRHIQMGQPSQTVNCDEMREGVEVGIVGGVKRGVMFQYWSVFEEGVSTVWIHQSSSRKKIFEEKQTNKQTKEYFSGIEIIQWTQFIRHSKENYEFRQSS